MAAQTRRVLVPWLDDRFEEPVIDVAILEGFQKLGYDRPTQEQAQAVRTFVLGSDVFVMLPTGSGKSLCYASLPYIFDSLRRSAGEKDAHHCIAVVVCPLSSFMLIHSARALAAAGRNNYIPPAQESRLILPDGFSLGISGWSRD